ncbi:MAG: rhodanese-like domain-containing protein [Gammaproteobacteria bacterium]|nr:rhodanese-like domain-containing protein [Gammaproteobacteria bacterium]
MVDEVNPAAAWALLQADPGAILLDVRSRMEYEYVGRPAMAIHVAWQEPPEWKVDPDFVQKVRARLRELRGTETGMEDIPVLAMCRSGQRSMAAGRALEEAGFRKVFNIAEGFEGQRDAEGHRSTVNGWRFRGLPWVQS